MKKFLVTTIFCVSAFYMVQAKTEKFGTWIEVDITKKLIKKLEFSFIPELRLQDDFKVDEYILEGKLSYNPYKFLGLSAAYRFDTNVKKKGNVLTHTAVFDVTGKTNFDRFKASLRARLTNDTDGGDVPWESFYFRPRAKLAYNIKGKKLEPYISYELFHSLRENEIYKGRFDIGFSRKFKKVHEFGLYYRLNDYYTSRSSIHILGIDYGFKL